MARVAGSCGSYLTLGATALAVGALAAAAAGCSSTHDHVGDGGGHPEGGAGVGGSGGGQAGVSGSAGSSGAGGACETPDAGNGCAVPGCGPGVTLPPGNDLTGVWIGPAGEVWAVGESGFVGRREPASSAWCWCAPSPPSTLRGIWGASSEDIFVVGDGGKLLRFDGTHWLTYLETRADLKAVFGTAPDNVWTVGVNGTAVRFDGSNWDSLDHPDSTYQLNAVWVDPAGVVRAGGTAPITGGTPGVSPTSEAVVLRHETAGAMGWTVETEFPQRGNASFFGLSGASATDVWAVGTNTNSGAATGIGFAARFDGTTWAPVANPDVLFEMRLFTDVAVATPDDGADWLLGGTAGLRFDGTNWTVEPALATTVAIDARDEVMYAVGADGLVLRWTAASGWTADHAAAKEPALPAP